MVRATITGCLWWVAAKASLCLCAIDDGELQRLRFRRLRLVTPLIGGGLALAAIGGSLNAAPARQVIAASKGLAATLQTGSYILAAALGFVAVALLLYVRVITRRAIRDRSADPVARKATLHGRIRAPEGGWPIRLRCHDGRWLWLTGSREVLAPIERHLRVHDRPYKMTVAIVHHPRCRVVKEIAGLRIEAFDPVWSGAEASIPTAV